MVIVVVVVVVESVFDDFGSPAENSIANSAAVPPSFHHRGPASRRSGPSRHINRLWFFYSSILSKVRATVCYSRREYLLGTFISIFSQRVPADRRLDNETHDHERRGSANVRSIPEQGSLL